MFFRESCFRQSGDKARKSNPTHYRCAQGFAWVYSHLQRLQCCTL